MHDHPPEGTRRKPEGQPVARWGRIPAWWLDRPDLDADGFAVLAALATYADEAGVCWPSQATLAAKLKRSRPTVNRILGRLEAAGLVVIEHRSSANGGRLSCRYRLRLSEDGGDVPTPAQARQTAVTSVNTADSALHIPCPAPSQEQLQPEQIPDSPDLRVRSRRDAVEVPADWQPGPADRNWAVERFATGSADLDRHVELFVIRCRAHGYRYRDIAAAWRAWLIQDLQTARTGRSENRETAERNRAKPSSPRAARRSDAGEQRLDAWAAAAARLQSVAPTAPSAWTRP